MKKIFAVIAVVFSGLTLIDMAYAKDRSKEEIFVGKTIINDNFELEASKLALKKSKNEKILVLARQVVDNHSQMQKSLQDVLSTTGIGSMVSFQELDDKHQDKLDDLAQSSVKDFDEDYVDAQIVEHDEAITLFEDYVSEGKNDLLKSFAKEQLPMLRMHQDAVQQVEKSL